MSVCTQVIAANGVLLPCSTAPTTRQASVGRRWNPRHMSEPTGFRVYPPGDRPDVEVRVTRTGAGRDPLPGRRARPAGGRTGSWHRATGETRLGTFHQEDVRPDTVDRSYGRTDERHCQGRLPGPRQQVIVPLPSPHLQACRSACPLAFGTQRCRRCCSRCSSANANTCVPTCSSRNQCESPRTRQGPTWTQTGTRRGDLAHR